MAASITIINADATTTATATTTTTTSMQSNNKNKKKSNYISSNKMKSSSSKSKSTATSVPLQSATTITAAVAAAVATTTNSNSNNDGSSTVPTLDSTLSSSSLQSPSLVLASSSSSSSSKKSEQQQQSDDQNNSKVTMMITLPKNAVEFALNPAVSYTEKASIRNHCRNLSTVFRLVDYMIRHALYVSIENGLVNIIRIIGGRQEAEIVDRYRLRPTTTVNTITTTGDNSDRSASQVDEVEVDVFRSSIVLLKIKIVMTAVSPVDMSTTTTSGVDADVTSIGVGVEASGSTPISTATSLPSSSSATALPSSSSSILLPSSSSSEYELSLEPNKSHLMYSFRQIIQSFIGVGVYKEGLFFDNRCQNILSAISNELNPTEILDILQEDGSSYSNSSSNSSSSSSRILLLSERCMQLFAKDVGIVIDHVVTYNFLCKQYASYKLMYEIHEESRLEDLSPDEITEQFNDFNRSLSSCDSVLGYQVVGIFQLDFNEVKIMTSSIINQCKQQHIRMVPDLFIRYGEKFYIDISRIIDIIMSKHQSLDEFVRVVDVYNSACIESETLLGRFQYVSNLRDIIRDQSITVSDAIRKYDLTLTHAWQKFTQYMALFETDIEGQMKVYKSHLINRTKSMLEPIETSKAFLQTPLVNSEGSNADEVLQQLTYHMHEMDRVMEHGKKIQHYQTVMKFTIYTPAVVDAMKDELIAMHMLWTEVKRLKELRIAFLSANFLDADSMKVETELDSCSANLMQACRAGISRTSDVFIWLAELLQNLLVITPIIRKLQSNSQLDFHIEKIHTILNRKIFSEYDMTVRELLTVVKIQNYSSELDVVYEESMFLRNIEVAASNLEKILYSQVFQYKEDDKNSTFICFSNLPQLSDVIEDVLLSLQSCQKSSFSKLLHQKKIRSIETITQDWLRMTTNLIILQSGYQKYRYLYTSPRTARYLGRSLQLFKEVDETWRIFVKIVKIDPKLRVLYGDNRNDELLITAVNNMMMIDEHIKSYCLSLKAKYPKLYLITDDQLFSILATMDPARTFEKSRALFPNYTSLLFSDTDKFTTTGASSNGEEILFSRTCSARNSLIDWFKAIEVSIHERLYSDINDFIGTQNKDVVDDLKAMKSMEQSRVCTLQVKFWSQLLETLSKNNRKKSSLKSQLISIKDQISLFITYTPNLIESYQIKGIANLLILLISFRDLLTAIIDKGDDNHHQHQLESRYSGGGGESPFLIDASMKKLWNHR